MPNATDTNTARDALLDVLHKRSQQRCRGRVTGGLAVDYSAVSVGCSACGARIPLPLQELPPSEDRHADYLLRIRAWVSDFAWKRWQRAYAVPGERLAHLPAAKGAAVDF